MARIVVFFSERFPLSLSLYINLLVILPEQHRYTHTGVGRAAITLLAIISPDQPLPNSKIVDPPMCSNLFFASSQIRGI